MNEKKRYLILVHGFMRRGGNMRYLAEEMGRRGYTAFAPTLPAVFQNVRACSESLARFLEKNLPGDGEKENASSFMPPAPFIVHFVGHSMGGLVIRDYLSRHTVRGLGRVVLIGTPNGGSRHANRLLQIPLLRHIFKALPDLAVRTGANGRAGLDIPAPLNVPPPEVGLVIGTRVDPVRKFFLRGEHDGLVTSESVRCLGAKDEFCLPVFHERLHWRPGTARAVELFLETGNFAGRIQGSAD